MAPFFRLANEVALCVGVPDPAGSLKARCRTFQHVLGKGPRLIAKRFAAAIRNGPPKRIVTYSYSSTVLRALISGRTRIRSVYCSEGRPDLEGRITAAKLGAAGIDVTLVSDAMLPDFIRDPLDGVLVVTGADQVRPRWFVNKVGTASLVMAARQMRRHFWILADSTKLVPNNAPGLSGASVQWAKSLWPSPPKNVSIFNEILNPAPMWAGIRVLMERGWMTPAGVRRELKRIRISPRLKELVK